MTTSTHMQKIALLIWEVCNIYPEHDHEEFKKLLFRMVEHPSLKNGLQHKIKRMTSLMEYAYSVSVDGAKAAELREYNDRQYDDLCHAHDLIFSYFGIQVTYPGIFPLYHKDGFDYSLDEVFQKFI